MKYKDIIKPFTPNGDYEVNIGLNYLETILKDYYDDYGLELNPDFQRGNVWTEEQQIAYLEFFLRDGATSRVIYFNCPFFTCGSVDDYKNGKYEMPMVCVDGLQRLTAIRKFLRNELKVCGYTLNEFEDKDILLRKMGLRFNVNNLKTKKEVLQWYLDFNTGGTVHSQEEITRVKKMLEELI
ncbi:DUF262 domain-containing protein [Clostridium botulinum]|uniref:DUF262 domain-containing protein n=1 Tax=Clostridium botulinum TaxID=1491 RepID=UPI001C9AD792|nr:DUF262 domain-containing protein [Clostridium botulinum]MBY6838776.1 DUF262 domain-containing protein [Clostridium botulinum]